MDIKFKGFMYKTGNVEIKNAVDPIIRLGIFVTLPSSFICIVAGIWAEIYSLTITGIISPIGLMIFFFFKYHYFSINDPDRLQTEKFQLEKQKMLLEITSKNPIPESGKSFTEVIPYGESLLPNLGKEEDEKK